MTDKQWNCQIFRKTFIKSLVIFSIWSWNFLGGLPEMQNSWRIIKFILFFQYKAICKTVYYKSSMQTNQNQWLHLAWNKVKPERDECCWKNQSLKGFVCDIYFFVKSLVLFVTGISWKRYPQLPVPSGIDI